MAYLTGSEALLANHYRTRGKYSPIGLDFGSGRIKMLQLKQKRGKIISHQLCHFPSPPGVMDNSDSYKDALLVKNLKKSLNDNNWQGKRACLTLDNKACYLRLITLPAMNKRELKQAVHWEASNCFPLDPDDAVISYMSLDNNTRGKPEASSRYLLAAALKETANRYTDLALQSGLYPLSLETPATALLRSIASRFNLENTCSENFHFYIDLGYSSTLLLLIRNGGYCFHRTLQQGVKNISKNIAAKTGSDYKTALRLVFEKGLYHEKSLAAEIKYLTRSINDSLAYWSDLNGTAPIAPATLTVSGGGSLIAGLSSFLQQSFGIKPGRAVSFQNFFYGPAKKDLKAQEQAALFSVAHGLTLRGWLK